MERSDAVALEGSMEQFNWLIKQQLNVLPALY
jgi:hypothetical protein